MGITIIHKEISKIYFFEEINLKQSNLPDLYHTELQIVQYKESM